MEKTELEAELKQERQIEFLRKHTLTDSDVRKMIAEKLERARAMAQILQKTVEPNDR
jgi:5-bromo-4-chloroindolyl phosphate hydrolysis protein